MPQIEKTEPALGLLRLTCTISPAEVMPEFEKELRKQQANRSFKGFRKGKTPTSFVKSMVGDGIFVNIVSKKIDDALNEHIKEAKYNYFGEPLPAEGQEALEFSMNSKNDITYAVDLGLLTEVMLPDIKTAQIARLSPNVTATDVDKIKKVELDQLQKIESVQVFGRDCISYLTTKGDNPRVILVDSNDMKPEVYALFEGKGLEDEIIIDDVYSLDTKLDVRGFNQHVLGLDQEEALEDTSISCNMMFIQQKLAPELDAELLEANFGENVTSESDLDLAIETKLKQSLQNQGMELFFDRIVDWCTDNCTYVISKVMLKRQIAASRKDDKETTPDTEVTNLEVEKNAFFLKRDAVKNALIKEMNKNIDQENLPGGLNFDTFVQCQTFYVSKAALSSFFQRLNDQIKKDDGVRSDLINRFGNVIGGYYFDSFVPGQEIVTEDRPAFELKYAEMLEIANNAFYDKFPIDMPEQIEA
jgi:Bacterial trigger factor protein (TF)